MSPSVALVVVLAVVVLSVTALPWVVRRVARRGERAAARPENDGAVRARMASLHDLHDPHSLRKDA